MSKTLLIYFRAEEHTSVCDFLTDIDSDFSICDFRTTEFDVGDFIVFYFTTTEKSILAYDYIRESEIDKYYIHWESYKQRYYRKDKIVKLVTDGL